MRYRKKPVVIEAFQLPAVDDWNIAPFMDWAEEQGLHNYTSGRDESIVIETLEGSMQADPGDWIIKGVAGEFYPCKPEIFEQTYEQETQELPLRVDAPKLAALICGENPANALWSASEVLIGTYAGSNVTIKINADLSDWGSEVIEENRCVVEL